MAVIITNMDMPSSCVQCDNKNCNYYRSVWFDWENGNDFSIIRHKDCPLKSADEMKQELFNCLFDNSDIDIGLAEIGEVEAIIDKYCDCEGHEDGT